MSCPEMLAVMWCGNHRQLTNIILSTDERENTAYMNKQLYDWIKSEGLEIDGASVGWKYLYRYSQQEDFGFDDDYSDSYSDYDEYSEYF